MASSRDSSMQSLSGSAEDCGGAGSEGSNIGDSDDIVTGFKEGTSVSTCIGLVVVVGVTTGDELGVGIGALATVGDKETSVAVVVTVGDGVEATDGS